jgi:Xaa-Pro aminopeptidase
MTINEKVDALRSKMRENNIHAYIIPSSDPHQSEYVAECWTDREWISGFTGSAGVVVITLEEAFLWTDVRYFLQADTELKGTCITLQKQKTQHEPEHILWLAENLPMGACIGFDGYDLSQAQYEMIGKKCSGKNISINANLDLISEIWKDRPALPTEAAFQHDVSYAGKSCKEKLAEIRAEMKEKKVDYHFISALDDIAWTFNIRGKDVPFNPVVIAYAVVSQDEALLFVDKTKISPELHSYLNAEGVRVEEYSAINNHLDELPTETTILIDASICSHALYKAVSCKITDSSSIPKQLKAIKNDTEIAHVRNVMAKDGAALANAFYWLENTLKERSVREHEFAEKLAECRSQQPLYQGESFSAIIGYKGNGAIIHYHPTEENSHEIKAEGILLADSGGQYLDGTTDITRTMALSEPTAEQKLHYTLVLKGMIALTRAVFPEGTTGGQLDLLARQFLWQHGLNYGHGTGHGVGFFLNVHEPPQGFAALSSERGKSEIKAGMLSSNEPGFYLENNYGIRIENLIVAKKKEGCEGYLCSETLTLYPLENTLIDHPLLTREEVEWINAYYQEVFETISPKLDPKVRDWFEIKCKLV